MSNAISVALSISAALGLPAFFSVERRLRARWRGRPLEAEAVSVSLPYRATSGVTRSADRAPGLVRAAALSGVLLGNVAVPGVTYAMVTLRFDGIALALLAGMVSAAAAWWTGWLLVARAPIAVEAAEHTATLAMMTDFVLAMLALAHIIAARTGWMDRESLGYAVVAGALAM